MKTSELKDMDLRELIDQLNSLDFENVGGWPAPAKAGVATLVLLVVLGLGYFFFIADANQLLEQQRNEEISLLKSYEKKAFEAHNMEQTFGALLKQLPKETEVPGLLEDITHTGLGSGLEFEEIKLEDEVEQEFYAELPIKVTAIGDYHSFGAFVSGVSGLPRIVTLHDFSISVPDEGKGKEKEMASLGLLRLDVTAKTYRYSSNDGAVTKNASAGKNK
jgi:type IV pilus assembly protein PilO